MMGEWHTEARVRCVPLPFLRWFGSGRVAWGDERGDMAGSTFELTGLWQRTLGRQHDPHHEAQLERLRSSYDIVRERVRVLAHERIAHVGKYTLHTVEDHCDRLWELADAVVGADCEFNPLEAYVLGLAFLVHDLGMAGLGLPPEDERVDDRLWCDIVSLSVRRRSARMPTDDEYRRPPDGLRLSIEETYARRVHAQLAVSMLIVPVGGEMLLEDEDLRNGVGHYAGEVAASHWWAPERLVPELGRRVGPPPCMPPGWTIDLLQIACLLRVVDALHLDSNRAPRVVAGVRDLDAEARSHWAFQGILQRPVVENGYVVFTGSRRFGPDEANAWWRCFDALATAHAELQAVDAILRSSGRTPLLAHGVAGGASPNQAANYVRVEGWEPVDARFHVSDVGWLVEKLGGRQLYGADPAVPLRELIQNAQDAVRAREALGRGGVTSFARASVKGKDDSDWLVVEDNGIGMPKSVMASSLVDFGRSIWGSDAALDEYPGLTSSRFKPAGQFGIGFFAVFMLSDDVVVFSRHMDAAREDTWVLEFHDGPQSRPLLRRATSEERLNDGGTSVWVRLRVPAGDGLLTGERRRGRDLHPTLPQLCAWLAPASDVDIECPESDADGPIVVASDWVDIEPDELLRRVILRMAADNPPSDAMVSWVRELMCPISSADGALAGRLCFAPPPWMWFRDEMEDEHWREDSACLVASGLRVAGLGDCIMGVVSGHVSRLDRSEGTTDLTYADIARWAEGQRDRAIDSSLSTRLKARIATEVWGLGVDPGTLPVALSADGWLDTQALASLIASRDSVRFVHINDYAEGKRKVGEGFQLLADVVVGYRAHGIGALPGPGLPEAVNEQPPAFMSHSRHERRVYEPVVRGLALTEWGEAMAESPSGVLDRKLWGVIGADGDYEARTFFTAFCRDAETLEQYPRR